MGMPMQEDTQKDTEMNTEPETVNVPINDESVNTDEGKSMEEINAEIEQELEEAIDLDPQAQLEGDVLKWKETAMRTAADLENYRKRMSREKTESIKFGNQRLIEDLLPVIDNFNMGMMAAEAESGSMIYMGMKMVQAQMDGFLSGQGVTEAETIVGSDFNPNIHDAMSQEESDEYEEGKIIRVMRKGYLLGDRLIRPANVVVSKKADEQVDAIEVESV
ncbi:MAG: molecular chaperone GrpE [Cryomorphaceae bacterium]|jgi:molecular chaperone GrpE